MDQFRRHQLPVPFVPGSSAAGEKKWLAFGRACTAPVLCACSLVRAPSSSRPASVESQRNQRLVWRELKIVVAGLRVERVLGRGPGWQLASALFVGERAAGERSRLLI